MRRLKWMTLGAVVMISAGCAVDFRPYPHSSYYSPECEDSYYEPFHDWSPFIHIDLHQDNHHGGHHRGHHGGRHRGHH